MDSELFFRPLQVSDIWTERAPKGAPKWLGPNGAFQRLGELAMSGSTFIAPKTGVLRNDTKEQAGLDEIGLVVRSGEARLLVADLAKRLGLPVASVPYEKELAETLLKLRFGDDFEAFSDFYRKIGSPASWGAYYLQEMKANWPSELWPLFDVAWRLPPILRRYYWRETNTDTVFGGIAVASTLASDKGTGAALRAAFDSLKK
jgi:hypothetical protein